MATCSSVLAWRIPWTEEHGGLQSIGLQRVRHDWMTKRAHTQTHGHRHTNTQTHTDTDTHTHTHRHTHIHEVQWPPARTAHKAGSPGP